MTCKLKLFVVILSTSSVVPTDARQQDGQATECTDPTDIGARRADPSRMMGGIPSAGYHGIRYGGFLAIGSDGTVGWATHPKIEAVYCDSPAEKAGLKKGDVLLTVNGVDSRQPGILAAKRPGMSFHIRVQRAGEILDYTVRSIPRPPEAK